MREFNARFFLLPLEAILSQDPLPHWDGTCDKDGAIEIDGDPDGAPDGALDGAAEIDGAPDGAPLGARLGARDTDGEAVGPDLLLLDVDVPVVVVFFNRRVPREGSATMSPTPSTSDNTFAPGPLAPRTSASFAC